MPISHLLEDFQNAPAGRNLQIISDETLEDARLSSFENGYQAGWDDASAAHGSEQSHISSEFARNLQDLSFTYQEAYNHVMRSIKPILDRMFTDILPEIAMPSLAMRLSEEAMSMARQSAEGVVILRMCSETAQRLEPLITRQMPIQLRLLEDDTIGAGQVYLSLGDQERCIDLDGLIGRMKTLVEEFTQDFGRPQTNG
jgi:flagellar assembly protein FliH